MKKFNLLLSAIFISIYALGQISSGGSPVSLSKSNQIKDISTIPVIRLSKINNKKLLKEDAVRSSLNKVKPYRYAIMIPSNINPKNSGKWEKLSNGGKLWRVAIHSQNAYSLEIFFDKYYLPPNAQVFIFNDDHSHILGAFTNKNNKKNKKLAISPLKGNKIFIEYLEPANTEFAGLLNIGKIGHGYKDLFKTLKSGACNVDINCPEGNNWQKEKRAVCKITFSGYLCSGALINNTSYNETPYFLTAHHCVSNENLAESVLFHFNYENTTCNGSPSLPQTLSGAELIATTNNLDFSLIKMSTPPPSSYQVYFAGWNKKNTPATETTCIHHPDGDVKKITYNDDPVTTVSYGSGYDANTHWRIADWESGTTEGGSSGSPLFDQNHKIVGDLTGGEASCSNNVNDYFAKFPNSWEDYSLETQQLKYWLDPSETDTDTLPGHDPNHSIGSKNVLLSTILNPLDSNYNVTSIAPKVIFKNKGSETLTALDMNYQIDGGSIVTESWTGSLGFNQSDTFTFPNKAIAGGNHFLKIYSSSPNGGSDTIPQNDTLSMDFFVAYDLDAKLEKINAPEDKYCNEYNFSPQVKIKNLGNTPLTSLNVHYQIDGGNIETKTWTGNLLQLQTDSITFNAFTDSEGSHVFKTFISNPNNNPDQNTDNDTLEKTYNVITGKNFRFNLTTDDYGVETSWTLTNSQSQLIGSGDNYDDNISIEENFCLDTDCYTFTIFDSESDGICCDYGIGEYTITCINDDLSIDTLIQGGTFSSSETTSFCTPILYPKFTATNTNLLKGETIQFMDSSLKEDSSISYLWNFDGGNPSSSTEENPLVTYSEIGSYRVTLTITDSQNTLTTTKSNYISVTNESKTTKKEIVVNPIPSNEGLITISASNLVINKLRVYNLAGKPLLEKTKLTNDYTLDLSEFENGIYLIKIYSSTGEHSKRIIIMK